MCPWRCQEDAFRGYYAEDGNENIALKETRRVDDACENESLNAQWDTDIVHDCEVEETIILW